MLKTPIHFTAVLILAGCVDAAPRTPTVPITAETDPPAAQTARGAPTDDEPPEGRGATGGPTEGPTPREEPPTAGGTDLPEDAARGIQWLLAHQLPSGAWGQGDSARAGEAGNVADTCMATIALIRGGSTPSSGPNRENVARAVNFVLGSIEESDEDSMYVTEIRNTRVQSKIGQYVDTFASLNLMNEVRGHMPNAVQETRLEHAIARVIHKLETNQTSDGTWAQSGWAPTLGQSLATRGLNRAARGGSAVSARVLERADRNARRRVDTRSRRFRRGGRGSAGVDLYDAAEAASTMRETADALAHKGGGRGKQASPAAAARQRARAASEALAARVQDPSFVSGFGSNGGEEFLSYMLISETLRASGGEPWENWRTRVAELLGGVQNGDGSWTGHHCITGRTFCTAMAVLVLLADRAPTSSSA